VGPTLQTFSRSDGDKTSNFPNSSTVQLTEREMTSLKHCLCCEIRTGFQALNWLSFRSDPLGK
jgi:hypothetical protein